MKELLGSVVKAGKSNIPPTDAQLDVLNTRKRKASESEEIRKVYKHGKTVDAGSEGGGQDQVFGREVMKVERHLVVTYLGGEWSC